MKTVKIGNQEWMAENLNVSTFRNGEPILEAKSAAEWKKAGDEGKPAWCYYENDPANGEEYGKLYNWFAVTDPRGLAPEGWHAPTDDEWQTLVDYLGGDYVAGGKIKETGTAHWESPNTNATNESGFSALPGGFRTSFGSYNDVGNFTNFCSSTEYDSNTPCRRHLGYNTSRVYRYASKEQVGNSVRCVRD